MVRSIGSFSRLVAGSVFLLAGLLIGPLRPVSTHAQWGNCLDDPKIWLSNGMEIDLSASIGAPASAVASVNYILHVGPGLTVSHITYTGNPPYADNVSVVNDLTSGQATSETTVLMLSPGGTSVQATTRIKDGASSSVSGTDGQDLVITL